MLPEQPQQSSLLERLSTRATRWIGSIQSLVVHTLLFIFCLVLVLLGVNLDKVLLIVTTIVSLEAIYLAIFIQMSVNRQDQQLHEVSEDIDEIQKDVEEIQEDVEEIQEDVEDIGEEVEDITEDDQDDDARYTRIEKNLEALILEIGNLKNIDKKK